MYDVIQTTGEKLGQYQEVEEGEENSKYSISESSTFLEKKFYYFFGQ